MKFAATYYLAIVGCLCMSGSTTQAAIIVNHATTQAYATELSGLTGSDFVVETNNGPTTSQSSVSSSYSQDGISADDLASASVEFSVTGGWVLRSYATASTTSTLGSSFTAQSFAQWDDILYLSNIDPNLVGGTLRLNFYAYGQVFNQSSRSDADNHAQGFTVKTAEAYLSANNSFDSPDFSSQAMVVSEGQGISTGWDSKVINEETFSYAGTFHLDIPLDPEGEGYVPGVPGSIRYRVTADSYAFIVFSDSLDRPFRTRFISSQLHSPMLAM